MFKFIQLILLDNKRGLLLRGVDAVVNPKQPNRAWKPTEGASFSGCHRVIVSDLEDHEDILSLILNFKRLREPFFCEI